MTQKLAVMRLQQTHDKYFTDFKKHDSKPVVNKSICKRRAEQCNISSLILTSYIKSGFRIY